MTRRVLATASFTDCYGTHPVELLASRSGKVQWSGAGEHNHPNCGYRPVPAERAIALAQRDGRFADVEVKL